MKQLALTALQWVLAIYLAFWVIHGCASVLTYIFTGATFNPLGMNTDRAMLAVATCFSAGAGIASAVGAKGVK